jgi:hypothetical protein
LSYPDRAPDLSLGPPTRLGDHRFRRRHVVQIDGHLGPRTWRDPKTGTMLWMLLAAYAAPILAPLAMALAYALAMTWAVQP